MHNFDASARRQQRIPTTARHNEITTKNDFGPPDGFYTLPLSSYVTTCLAGYSQEIADEHALLQISPSPLRSLSVPQKPNHPNRGSFDVLGTSEIWTWCEGAESRYLNQKLLYDSDITLFPSNVNNGSFSTLSSGVDFGNVRDAETEDLVTADAPSTISAADHIALGSKWFDGDVVAQLEEYDDSHRRWRSQPPVPEPKTGHNWRPESSISGESSQYVAVPPKNGNQIAGASDVPMSSRTNSPISRNRENDDDFPLLPNAHKHCVYTGAEPLKTSQYTSESAKPSMTWAERLKATIASPSEKRSLDTPTGLQGSGSVPRNSANLTTEPSQQIDSKNVSDRTKSERVPISSLCAYKPVSPKRALLPIEWQTAPPSSSPVTTPNSDNSLSNLQPSVRSPESPTRAYGPINKFQGAANSASISMIKGSQTVTASRKRATRASGNRAQTVKLSDPVHAPERLVEATQHEKHLLSAPSRSSRTPSLLSASSATFIPRTTVAACSDPPKKPSYAEVASLSLPAVPRTPTTPSSSSAAFISAPQTPEHPIQGAKGALMGEMAEPNLDIAAAAGQGFATPLKIRAGIEEGAAGSRHRIVQEQPIPEHQIPLSRCNSDNQGRRHQKKKGWRRKRKEVSSTMPRSAESLHRQPPSLTSSSHYFVGRTRARSEPNPASLTAPSFKTSKVDFHGVPNGFGTELSLPTEPLQSTPQVYGYKAIGKVAPCSKITIVIAAEHVGWYCPACKLKQTG